MELMEKGPRVMIGIDGGWRERVSETIGYYTKQAAGERKRGI